MNLDDIKQAVRDGKKVCWASSAYEVINPIKDLENPDNEQWLVRCKWNNHCVGLTRSDNVTLADKPEQYFIDES